MTTPSRIVSELPRQKSEVLKFAVDPIQVLFLSTTVKRERLTLGRERLVDESSGRIMQVGGQAALILDQLEAGASLTTLMQRTRLVMPAGSDSSSKVSAFVTRLGEAGMLQNLSVPSVGPRIVVLPNLDATAQALAVVLLKVPRPALAVATVLALILAAMAVVAMLAAHGLSPWVRYGNWRVVLVLPLSFAFIILHECAHAVVARLTGIRIVQCGLLVGAWRPPRFFVRSSVDYLKLDRLRRMRICLAGPAADLVMLGGLSSILLLISPSCAWRPMLAFAFLTKALALTGNLSPLSKSDMSDALAAYFDDFFIARASLVRGQVRTSNKSHVRTYRTLAAAFVILAITSWFFILLIEFRAGDLR